MQDPDPNWGVERKLTSEVNMLNNSKRPISAGVSGEFFQPQKQRGQTLHHKTEGHPGLFTEYRISDLPENPYNCSLSFTPLVLSPAQMSYSFKKCTKKIRHEDIYVKNF